MSKIDRLVNYSIVIPAFNEDQNISPLLTRIIQVMSDFSYEIIIVDNGSTDETASTLK